MPLLAQVFDLDISQLMFGLDIMNADSAFLRQFLHKEVTQLHVLDSLTVGLISGDAQSGGVIKMQRYAVKARAKSQLLHHI